MGGYEGLSDVEGNAFGLVVDTQFIVGVIGGEWIEIMREVEGYFFYDWVWAFLDLDEPEL